MRARAAILITAAAFAIPPASAGARTGPPAGDLVRTAVARAERSPELWATVNICNTTRNPGVIGIRAQMPALGFRARLWMRFQVQYWSASAHGFLPVPGSNESVALGSAKTGLHQSGVQFTFAPHAGSLRGMVAFQWRLGRKLIGQASRSTRRGHPSADFGDPPHFSSGRCDLS